MSIIRIIRGLLSVTIAIAIVFFAISHANSQTITKDLKPLPKSIVKIMAAKNMDASSPIYMRAFKEENIIEIWKQARDGQYGLVKSYKICMWSGKLGPKFKEGDYQTPEGFYTIEPGQMHPKSNYHLAFNIGFPNEYDRANKRTGSFLMVHGVCKSIGCYAMTDDGIEEIYAFARDAFLGGQQSFEFHAFPFKMNAKNMARYAMDKNTPFWSELKKGYDVFEITHQPPRVEVCGKDYVVTTGQDSRLKAAVCRAGDKDLIAKLNPAYQRRYMADYALASTKAGQSATLPTMSDPR